MTETPRDDSGVVDLGAVARNRAKNANRTVTKVRVIPEDSPGRFLPPEMGGPMGAAALLLGGSLEHPKLYDASAVFAEVRRVVRTENRALAYAVRQMLIDAGALPEDAELNMLPAPGDDIDETQEPG
tara:strand:+ start:787 stop:1167 length:381 start_codon:yes stop_codon:yes gene_type:complete